MGKVIAFPRLHLRAVRLHPPGLDGAGEGDDCSPHVWQSNGSLGRHVEEHFRDLAALGAATPVAVSMSAWATAIACAEVVLHQSQVVMTHVVSLLSPTRVTEGNVKCRAPRFTEKFADPRR